MDSAQVSIGLEKIADDMLLLSRGSMMTESVLAGFTLDVTDLLLDPDTPENVELQAFEWVEDMAEVEEYLVYTRDAFKCRARTLYEISAKISADSDGEIGVPV